MQNAWRSSSQKNHYLKIENLIEIFINDYLIDKIDDSILFMNPLQNRVTEFKWTNRRKVSKAVYTPLFLLCLHMQNVL